MSAKLHPSRSLSARGRRGDGCTVLQGRLLPVKDGEVAHKREKSDPYDSDGDDPQFMDAREIEGGGMVVQSTPLRRTVVIIKDKYGPEYRVSGFFPLVDPWWSVKLKVKRDGTQYFAQGYPSYALENDMSKDILSLFLHACKVHDDTKQTFINWLPSDATLTFDNLKKLIEEFQMNNSSNKINIESSGPGLLVMQALECPLTLKYLPKLLPRKVKGIFFIQTSESSEDPKPQIDLLKEIETILASEPWKFGFQCVTCSYSAWRKQNSDKPWKFSKVKALVVDEGSLVSVNIFSTALKFLCNNSDLAKLIILGDVRQLPSIEPGNLLADIFTSLGNKKWVIELRTNHRAESQLIVDNATRISQQKYPEFDAVINIVSGQAIQMPDAEKKFILVSLSSGNDQDLDTAIKALLDKGPGLEDDKHSQFIAFRRRDCMMINELCSRHYSEHSIKNHKNKFDFQVKDKVCCTKNAYVKDLKTKNTERLDLTQSPGNRHTINCEEAIPSTAARARNRSQAQSDSLANEDERLCNGEIFFITDDVERDKIRELTLRDSEDREYTLNYKALRRCCGLTHAWARTIHTFQGSEEETVVYVLGSAGRQNWKHVYTAVTRGRKRVYIVAKLDQLGGAIANKARDRKTRLQQRLKETLTQNRDDPGSGKPIGGTQVQCVSNADHEDCNREQKFKILSHHSPTSPGCSVPSTAPPNCEVPSTSTNHTEGNLASEDFIHSLQQSPSQKRPANISEGPGTPAKLSRVAASKENMSPLGCSRLQNLSLGCSSPKQLFKP
eukprot:XP_012815359.1 PREDICTED: DNA helicase B isoform X3 [Xenopus tropicalis]